MKKYEKPVIQRVSNTNLVLKLIRQTGSQHGCRQCSGCHGCR